MSGVLQIKNKIQNAVVKIDPNIFIPRLNRFGEIKRSSWYPSVGPDANFCASITLMPESNLMVYDKDVGKLK